jgi:hypothetical protein
MDAVVRCHVAMNPSAPHEALIRLKSDANPVVCEYAAKNSGPPPEVLTPKPTGQELFAALQTARSALIAWLADEFPIRGYVAARDGGRIHASFERGKVLRISTDVEGNPNIEAQSDAGTLFCVNPLQTAVGAIPTKSDSNVP